MAKLSIGRFLFMLFLNCILSSVQCAVRAGKRLYSKAELLEAVRSKFASPMAVRATIPPFYTSSNTASSFSSL